MAFTINNFWGAETGGAEESSAFAGTAGASSSVVHTGAYSYTVPVGTTNNIHFNPFESVTDAGNGYIVGFWHYYTGTPNTNRWFWVQHNIGGGQSECLTLRRESGTGNITLFGGGSLLDTAGTLSTGEWHYIEIYFQYSTSAAWEWWIDGVSQGSGTGANIQSSGTGLFDIYFQQNGATNYFDDIYFASGATSASDRLGGCEVFPSTGFTLDTGGATSSPIADWEKVTGASTLDFQDWKDLASAPVNAVYTQYSSANAQGGGIDCKRPLPRGFAAGYAYPGPYQSGDYLETVIFDGNVSISDPDNNWSGDTGAFNGGIGTFADTDAACTETTGELRGTGVAATSASTDAKQVWLRINWGVASGNCRVYSGSDLVGDFSRTGITTLEETLPLSEPTGGWTLSKIQNLEVVLWGAVNLRVSALWIVTYGETWVDGDDNIKAIKGLWRMARDGGGGTDHFGLIGNTGSAITDSDRTQDFDPTTSPANFTFVRSTNLPLSTEHMRVGHEKSAGGQLFQCYAQFGFWLHVPTGTTYVEVDADTTGSATVTGNSEALKKTSASAVGSSTSAFVGTKKPKDTEFSVTDNLATVTGLTASVIGTELQPDSEIVTTFYHDAAGGITDSGAAWTDDANAADGSTSTYAFTSSTGGISTNNLLLNDSTMPGFTDVNTVSQWRVRAYTYLSGTDVLLSMRVTGPGLAHGLLVRQVSGTGVSGPAWSGWVPPSATLQWSSLAQVDFNFYADGTSLTEARVYLAEFEVTHLGYHGWATIDGQSARIASAVGSSDGTSTVTVNTSATAQTDADSAGTATVTGVGEAVQAGVDGASAGSATVTGNAATVYASSSVAIGTSTITVYTEATKGTIASTTASASLAGAGAAIWDVVAQSIAQATTSADSGSIRAADLNAAASASVAGVTSEYIVATTADAAGTSTVTGLSTATTATTAASTSISSVAGYSANTVSTSGASVGTSTITGYSAVIRITLASSTAFSTVVGVTPERHEFEGYRFRNDNGTEITATWLEPQDTNISIDKNVRFRIRTLIDVIGDPTPRQITLQVKKSTDPDTDWRDV